MELQIRNLSKTYANSVHALKDVTLTIPRGMFGLLGTKSSRPPPASRRPLPR